MTFGREYTNGRWQTIADTDGGGGSQTVLTADFSLTAAQIKALFTTPLTVIAAPGANKVISILRISSLYTAGATPFEGGSGELLIATAGDPMGEQNFDISSPETIEQVDDVYSKWRDNNSAGSIHADPVLYLNKAWVICAQTANPTLGDGTLKGTVYYVVTDLT